MSRFPCDVGDLIPVTEFRYPKLGHDSNLYFSTIDFSFDFAASSFPAHLPLLQWRNESCKIQPCGAALITSPIDSCEEGQLKISQADAYLITDQKLNGIECCRQYSLLL
jgi:hypothetical protein